MLTAYIIGPSAMLTTYIVGTAVCVVGVSVWTAVEDYKDHVDRKRPLDFFRFFNNVMPGICLAFMWPAVLLFGVLAAALAVVVGAFMVVMWLFYAAVCRTIERFSAKKKEKKEHD